MTEIEVSPAEGAYRLDQLGWLQFEQLCSLVLEVEAGLRRLAWVGRADGVRAASAPDGLRLAGRAGWPGPVSILVIWVRAGPSPTRRFGELATRTAGVGDVGERTLLLTNLDGAAALRAVAGRRSAAPDRFVVIGARELGESLDRHPPLRAAMPSVLGLRDPTPLVDAAVRDRSSFDFAGAQALARVFSPTRAFARARRVLARHRFVVLSGPPEMGKTAIARMIGLAQLTDGWEVHECTSPEQVWAAISPNRRQLFVADDAFGSTEYRPDAAERWALELARLLAVLDDGHWLIWTSRPAPLKAGLRRVQRERGSERFPAPGEVLVDASDLDLAEKTLILFRHVKALRTGPSTRALVRSAGVSIVEHPHFTPERIRRFVTDRLGRLPALRGGDHAALRELVGRELATPTAAMRASFEALGCEHRDLLIALLDAPAGLVGDRELAVIARRHHPGGLSRPPHELVDRLADHFLRVTTLGIGWVHPSWRDLVIDELRRSAGERRRFLAACGLDGAMLALSRAGGEAGERALPLLVEDADWDVFGDRLRDLLPELEDHDLARMLQAVGGALDPGTTRRDRAEACSVAAHALGATRRAWDDARRPLPLFLLEAWHALNVRLLEPGQPPEVCSTWTELHPGGADPDLGRADAWLALAELLARRDPAELARLGFPAREYATLGRLINAAGQRSGWPDEDRRTLADGILDRLRSVVPELSTEARRAQRALTGPSDGQSRDWWTPEDLAAPPSDESIAAGVDRFRREDVTRVLRDL